MKPYSDLTTIGKLRRLRTLALAALAHYDLKSPTIAYHGFATNLLYRVKTPSGERFMLRLAVPGWRTFDDLQSEALWLEALARDTDLATPRVMPARSGELVVPVSRHDVPTMWNATLMGWVPGRLLGCCLTERNLQKMGALLARLHHHGAWWTPPFGFTTRRFQHWLSREEENLIVEDRQQAAGQQPQSGSGIALPCREREVLDRMHRHVESAYAAIDRSDLRVIHCDLWHDNIKLHQGVLHPIDFEDTVWGFRAHDIAMAMLDLLETTGEARYAELLPAFRRGYVAHLSWPEDPIEPFQIGRLLWKLNWVARHQPSRLGTTVKRHISLFEHYERTGQVMRPPTM